jgi:two-component system response regulator PilR (NtrC family)
MPSRVLAALDPCECAAEKNLMVRLAKDAPLPGRILVVDDEAGMREFLQIMLEKEGYVVATAGSVSEAVTAFDSKVFDLVLTDLKMPGGSGLDLLRAVKARDPECVVYMMTAYGDAESAVEAMKRGAYDYLSKPFKVEEVKLLLRNGLETRRLAIENRLLRETAQHEARLDRIIGSAPAMKDVFDLILRTAVTDCTVLITGETGTGKELVARAIHSNGPRRERPFVAINCGAIPEPLLESELFGHMKGAFTGAVDHKEGLFEVARGGTVLLDEIGEAPPLIQVKLLRAIQERKIRRVGGTDDIDVDVRFLAATNRDLEDEILHGRFREDLYYRLNVIPIHLPPLRDRRQDIPLLIESFLKRLAGGSDIHVGSSFIDACMTYRWPGNIRELENAVERATVLSQDGELRAEHVLQFRARPVDGGAAQEGFPVDGLDFEAWIADQERRLVAQALERAGGVKKDAAALLKVSPRSFRYLADKYGL